MTTTKPLKSPRKKGENDQQHLARVMLSPEFLALTTIGQFDTDLDATTLLDELKAQTAKIHDGNMQRAESVLMCQATTLDRLFANLAQRAIVQSNMDHYDRFMKLALKAQNQCRMTLESLSNIKNPPVIYAKQANVTTGLQQINNGTPATRTREIENQQNELL